MILSLKQAWETLFTEMNSYRHLQMDFSTLAPHLHHLPHTPYSLRPTSPGWHHGRFQRKLCHWLVCILQFQKGLNVLKVQGSCIRIDFLREKGTGKRKQTKRFGFSTNLIFDCLGPLKKPPSDNLQLTSQRAQLWVSCLQELRSANFPS